jgi:hypothetical protein
MRKPLSTFAPMVDFFFAGSTAATLAVPSDQNFMKFLPSVQLFASMTLNSFVMSKYSALSFMIVLPAVVGFAAANGERQNRFHRAVLAERPV